MVAFATSIQAVLPVASDGRSKLPTDHLERRICLGNGEGGGKSSKSTNHGFVIGVASTSAPLETTAAMRST